MTPQSKHATELTADRYPRRLEAVRQGMQRAGAAAVFLPPSANLEYLSGELRPRPFRTNFAWPGGWITGAWILLDREPIFTVPRMAADYDLVNARGWPVRVLGDDEDPIAFLGALLTDFDLDGQAVAVDDRARARFVMDLHAATPTLRLVSASPILGPVRARKDEGEVELLRQACAITDAAFADVVARLKPGVTEVDIIAELEGQLRRRGSEPAYPVGVWGWGAGFPRQRLDTESASSVPIEGKTTIAFDFGAWWRGYCTDFSRVVHFEDPGPEYTAAYAAVVRAQDAVIAAMTAHAHTAQDLYEIGMAVLGDAGLREFFPDRLGHGIGMEVHELPSIYAGDETLLEAGMVLTVEPQVMKTDMHVRLEDLVVVGRAHGEKLNAFRNDLLVLG